MQPTPAHNNNFDFLRFLFASLVIFSHSYALLLGDISQDPFFSLTGRVLSELGVCGFFSISGYLIHQSLQRSSSLQSFSRKRLLRIFPGLIVAVLVTTFVLGPLLSTDGTIPYLSNRNTYGYALHNIALLPGRQTLPGVFANNAEHAVNGSLWTLRYELLLYAGLGLLFVVSLRMKKVWLPLCSLLLIASIFILRHQVFPVAEGLQKFLYYFAVLGSYFLGGASLSLFADNLQKHKTSMLIISSILFTVSLAFRSAPLETVGIVCFIVMVITFGLHYARVLHFSRYTGDISYGTYIYAYPIQQALIVWLQPGQVWMLLLPSLLLSWLAGLASWHWVEKRFIRGRKSVG